ncbi:hypothetical protein HMPREF9997_00435 [Corynebacterium durum F0235]|uniref:Uncharacterized protein n=1 Tax=Corynebacterium durum F0235 TaxID=1035195 RepID=L1MLE1_9CORY|nr:hypothetical protein HMPREF9997_00435 [Corynebacterium durum F0235]
MTQRPQSTPHARHSVVENSNTWRFYSIVQTQLRVQRTNTQIN